MEEVAGNHTGGMGADEVLNDLDAVVGALEESRDSALEAAERLQGAAAGGKPVAADDIGLLEAYDQALKDAGATLGLAGGAEDGLTLDAVVAGAGELRGREKREQEASSLLEALSRLAASPAEEAGSPLLAMPKQRAVKLSAGGALVDEENIRVARGLAALVYLNEAAEEDRDALVAEAMDLLPVDCHAAVGVAAYGNLKFAPPILPEEPEEEAESPLDAAELGPEGDFSAIATEKEEDAEVVPGDEKELVEDSLDSAEVSVEPSDEEVEATLDGLLREKRFGLARWIAATWSSPDEPGLASALEALAYAVAMRSSTGEPATSLRELIQALPSDALHGSKAASLIALVAGLRGNLVAPYSVSGNLLGSVASAYSDQQGLAALIEGVTEAGRRGVSAPDMTDQVQNIASTEDNLQAVQERAEQMLQRSTIKYQRASKVWLNWIGPEGMLGSLLHMVIDNRVDELQEAEQSVLGLRDAKTLERHLDETARRLATANRQRKIVEAAREKLMERAEESLAIVSEWVDVSRELDRVKQQQANENWQQALLGDLRTVAQNAREEVISTWKAWAEGDDLMGAAATGTLSTIEEIFGLLVDGKPLAGEEEAIDEVLGLDLLRAPGLGLNSRLEPIGELALSSLLAAAQPSDWAKAFEIRVGEADFNTAERIVGVVGRTDPDLAAVLDKQRLNRLTEKRDHLVAMFGEATRLLGGARREGRISDSESLGLSSRLSALELRQGEQDLRGRDVAIREFLGDLHGAEEEGKVRARAEYASRLENEAQLQPHRQRLQALLDGGEISTLEELVLAIERGDELPEEEELLFKQLTEFFPGVTGDPQVARFSQDGEALREAVNGRGKFGALDFSSLKDEEIEPVLTAIEAWQRLECRELKEAEDDLARVLDLIGLTVETGVDGKAWKPGPDKRGRGEISAKPLGKALVPAFGSDAQGGRYRLLMIWERMSDDAIAALISQEDGEQPIIVLFFGNALTETVRRGVADQLRQQPSRRAVALIDAPAFLFLASRGGRKLATTMRITMPFSAVNPYTPFAPGSVPLEMFYGRGRELADLIDRRGTSFIYGGRRLGKSALLRAAERKFHDEAPLTNTAIYVDLKTKGIGEREPAEEIRGEIAKALKDAGVMTHRRAKDPSFEDIRTEVKAWFEGNDKRRILLLLDECDSFLNADAKANFPNVTELKALMEETDQRFKPVFAGLHQVRRFQRMPNQPLAHLGYPTPVGPLKPQPAYDLITKPLEALGLRFESSDLPVRILTATNYQPSLIQLFCSELVDHMLEKAWGPGTPPYMITPGDVDAVHGNQRVIEEMRTRFGLTTNLDPRYQVIANSVAFEALGSGLSVGLSASEIRAMCDEYWPAGFAKTDSDEFRALLEEMDSLGVLFEDDRGLFMMRSPNVLRMLGTAEQIEEGLNASNELDLPQGFEAASFRDRLGDDPYRRQPFTHEQVADILANDEEAEGSLLRVVVGSAATGIGDARACLRGLFEDGSGRYSFKDDSGQDFKRLRARFKKPLQKRRAVAYELKPSSPGEHLAGIHSVAEKLTEPNINATLVFVLGEGALTTWKALVVPNDEGEAGYAAAFEDQIQLIELKRWSKAGLRAWAQAQDVELFFSQDNSLGELMRVTGGWPILVNRIVDAYRQDHDWKKAIKGLEQWLNSGEGAAELCAAIGLDADEDLAQAWSLFIVYEDPISFEEFKDLAEGEGIADAGRVAELLRSMQVLELDSKGRYMVEKTAAGAWRKRVSADVHASS